MLKQSNRSCLVALLVFHSPSVIPADSLVCVYIYMLVRQGSLRATRLTISSIHLLRHCVPGLNLSNLNLVEWKESEFLLYGQLKKKPHKLETSQGATSLKLSVEKETNRRKGWMCSDLQIKCQSVKGNRMMWVCCRRTVRYSHAKQHKHTDVLTSTGNAECTQHSRWTTALWLILPLRASTVCCAIIQWWKLIGVEKTPSW